MSAMQVLARYVCPAGGGVANMSHHQLQACHHLQGSHAKEDFKVFLKVFALAIQFYVVKTS